MNIMLNQTEKFIVQLCRVTQWRMMQHSEVSKCQLISQPKLDKFQLQCYCKCKSDGHSFLCSNTEVCATVIDDTLLQTRPLASATRQQTFGFPST